MLTATQHVIALHIGTFEPNSFQISRSYTDFGPHILYEIMKEILVKSANVHFRRNKKSSALPCQLSQVLEVHFIQKKMSKKLQKIMI